MNATLMHDIIFYAMYACVILALVIIIERSVYFAYNYRQAKALQQALNNDSISLGDLPAKLRNGNSLPMQMLAPVLSHKQYHNDEVQLDKVIDGAYLGSKTPMSRGLWLLDTIVTAAPLLGLLGTIMGIIDTFKALAASGVSDASQVSAGMGTALYATGLGIAIALLCLVANNFLQSRMDKINALLKILLIRASSISVHADHPQMAWADGKAAKYA